MNARGELAAYIGYGPDEHDAKFEEHLDAYRTEVLREAEANLQEMFVMAPSSAKGPGINFAIGVLQAMHYGAGEKTTAPAAAVTPPSEDIAGQVVQEYGAAGEYQRAAVIRDRIDDLLDHIRRYPDRTWTTAGVHAFYQDRAPKRATARRDLETLHTIGWLELHDDKGRRSYTLAARTGGGA